MHYFIFQGMKKERFLNFLGKYVVLVTILFYNNRALKMEKLSVDWLAYFLGNYLLFLNFTYFYFSLALNLFFVIIMYAYVYKI